MKIIENRDDRCNGQIFNIGNPRNEATVKDLAIKLKTMFAEDSRTKHYTRHSEIIEVYSRDFYGEGYQDIDRRVPSIAKATEIVGWQPLVDLDTAPQKTLDYHRDEPSRRDGQVGVVERYHRDHGRCGHFSGACAMVCPSSSTYSGATM